MYSSRNGRVVRFQVPLEVCCVLPTYSEAILFLSRYCSALCFIFCQAIIKECPDIYSFSSSPECLNFSHHLTFVRTSLAWLGISGSGGGIQNRATFNQCY